VRRGPLAAREPIPCIIVSGHDRYVASGTAVVHLTRNDTTTLCGQNPKRPNRIVVVEEEQQTRADCDRCLSRTVRVVKSTVEESHV
jgi:hypothetical protein